MNKKTNIRRPFFLSAVLAVCLTPVLAHAQSTPASQFDIAGIRLGMTEAEARAAIQAFDPALEIVDVMGVYNYSDGASMHRTPEFLDKIEALERNRDGLTVYFSGPAGDARVIAVHRDLTVVPNPPTAAQLAQSLIEKYGRPSGINGTAMSHLVWEEEGKPSCVRFRNGNNVTLSVTPLNNMSSAEEFYERHRNRPIGYAIPPDLAECGVVMDYNWMSGDPVRAFIAELKDIGAIVATERARAAWVEELETQAIRKRQSQGQTPRL